MSMQIDKRPSMGRFPDESGIPPVTTFSWLTMLKG